VVEGLSSGLHVIFLVGVRGGGCLGGCDWVGEGGVWGGGVPCG
jgi:hypothetical protein